MHATTAMLLGGALALLGLGRAPEAQAPAPAALAPAALAPAAPDPEAPDPEAPDPETEIRACQQRCEGDDLDETDAATCRLNCRQATEGKDDVSIIRWTKEKPLGGSTPGHEAPPPTVTTTTTVTPRGTTTTTTTETTASPTVAPPTLPPPVVASARQRYYFGLVDCQDRCNANRDDSARARCKLRCLRLQPGPPPRE